MEGEGARDEKDQVMDNNTPESRFNNNRGDDAPNAARRMRELLGQDSGPPPTGTPAQASLL